MRRILGLTAGLLLLTAVSVYAQGQVRPAQVSSFAVLAANGDAKVIPVEGYVSGRIQALDSYSGTWEVECSSDGGSTYDADDEIPLTLLGASNSAADSVTDTVGIWDLNVANCTHIKIVATAGFASTDVTLIVRLSAMAGSGVGAGGGGGLTDAQLRASAVVVDASGTTVTANITGVNGIAPLNAYTTGNLQTGATANGNGTPLSVRGYTTAIFTVDCTVSCTGGTQITLQGSENGTTFETLVDAREVNGVGVGGVIINQSNSVATVWVASIAGMQSVRAVISGYSAGTVSVSATAVLGTAGPNELTTQTYYLTSAASTNSTLIKGRSGQVVGIYAVNTTSTLYYLRMYNLASAPTCSSATGFVETIPLAHGTGTGAGISRPQAPQAYSTGIGFCLTGGGSSTDNTNAAAGVYLTVLYR